MVGQGPIVVAPTTPQAPARGRIERKAWYQEQRIGHAGMQGYSTGRLQDAPCARTQVARHGLQKFESRAHDSGEIDELAGTPRGLDELRRVELICPGGIRHQMGALAEGAQ